MSQVPVHLLRYQAYASIPAFRPTPSTLRLWVGWRTLLGLLVPESVPSLLLSDFSVKQATPCVILQRESISDWKEEAGAACYHPREKISTDVLEFYLKLDPQVFSG